MSIYTELTKLLQEILSDMNIDVEVHLEHPNDIHHGDFSTNLAMSLSKKLGKNPREIAADIKQAIEDKNHPLITAVDIAGPGFINITIDSSFFTSVISTILDKGMTYGNLDIWKGKKILVEHSSPNLFKPFHIGHMMNNTIGESMARLCYISGADTKVISYPSDVSLGIGKAVWQLMQYGVSTLDEYDEMGDKMAFLGKCYAEGTQAYKDNPELEKEIRAITQDIYMHRDTPAYAAYKIGRDLNLQYFIQMTARLGSVFDGYIFESEAGIVGKQLVAKHTGDIYEESNGAIVYKGEDDGLHTRVFINKDGNPTYEAKDTGLLKLKFDTYDPDLSIFVTDHEQGPYFKVVGTAAGKINKKWQDQTHHLTHGRMQFKGEKMSSRLGNTPIVSDILESVNEVVFEKAEGRDLSAETADMIAVAALKYSILRTQPGKNINFDPETSLSFEGESGPYLQYTYARCRSVLEKAAALELTPHATAPSDWDTVSFERHLYRFEKVLEESFLGYAPHHVAHFAIDIAQQFNSWYAGGKIIDTEHDHSGYKLALTQAVATVIKKSLWVLGIDAPESM